MLLSDSKEVRRRFAQRALAAPALGGGERGDMVKEGHDSTVRPKLQTWEFDNGRAYLDQWAADGKPMWSRRTLGRFRAISVLVTAGITPLILLSDWGEKETILTPFQRIYWKWWTTFIAMDEGDVVKARSVAKWSWAKKDEDEQFWTWGRKERRRPRSDAAAARQAFGEVGVINIPPRVGDP
eukprot:scaffold234564_cov30-Tisochrysis_lutea.AAC.1